MELKIKVVSEDDETKDKGNCLWKFHGDVRNIKRDNKIGEVGWIFPTDGGSVFESFIKYRDDPAGLKDSLFVVVVVGYSESDKSIRNVIKSLEDNGRRTLFRLTLDLRKLEQEKYLVGPSNYVLPRIFE